MTPEQATLLIDNLDMLIKFFVSACYVFACFKGFQFGSMR